MNYKVGDKVVYPNHGLCVIERITNQNISGQDVRFYQLRILENDSIALVPVNNIENVGIRRIIDKKDVKELMKMLQNYNPTPTQDWKNRFKENSEKMRSGSVTDVAEVLKMLALVNSKKSLSFREKKMFDRAKQLLVAEIAAVENAPEGVIEEKIDQALLNAIENQVMGNA